MGGPRQAANPRSLHFSKMHGAGNDFVVLDLRGGRPAPSPALCRALADRHTGVGCDQILTVEDAAAPGAVAVYGIWNADGSRSQQCGNGARCIAAWLVRDGAVQAPEFLLDSPAGRHPVRRLDADRFRIELGVPDFEPAHIPMRGFDAARDRYRAGDPALPEFGAVSMGNPHALVEVEDVDAAPVADVGPALQRDETFPESVNVGFAQVVARDRVRLRVYERGVGETLACGSGACAAAVVLMKRGRIDRVAAIELPGGELRIEWPADDAPVAMTGPTAFVFEGEWHEDRF
ncbi:diaminopimelate epimerase [Marilutibacter alkalisoli]|uniref:Diaminopimelate epimerase n=1 Tax=Marilutibacter alkalisoli TaxID=2591633 RepID=A0A514BV79_9GAMM|nr:diaminopimelate epimerase [Lysobacter alkalisoli]QDH71215.1 diaminopimelate epimerase [Lysobacter alkalisoli]